jgi:hypothetical protein
VASLMIIIMMIVIVLYKPLGQKHGLYTIPPYLLAGFEPSVLRL